jgi:hypothetical protein
VFGRHGVKVGLADSRKSKPRKTIRATAEHIP